MTITYIQEQNIIIVESPEITAFVANIDDYASITVAGEKCNSNTTTLTYDTTDVFDVNKKYYIIGNTLYIRPIFFNSTVFFDNVYKFNIKMVLTDSGYTIIENCLFVDITYGCKVAGYLKNIIEENADKYDTEKVGTTIHLMHYALVNGSNCGCNCLQMCEVFGELKNLLDNSKPENTDCGC